MFSAASRIDAEVSFRTFMYVPFMFLCGGHLPYRLHVRLYSSEEYPGRRGAQILGTAAISFLRLGPFLFRSVLSHELFALSSAQPLLLELSFCL